MRVSYGWRLDPVFPVSNQYNMKKEKVIMKIAVTYENGEMFQHFGHTEQFKLYDSGKRNDHQMPKWSTPTEAVMAHLPAFWLSMDVDTLICGGIGGGAQNALAQAGIRLYGGCNGNADDAVAALLAGSLGYNPNVRCNHHDHEGSGHTCGDHGCGSHSCH